MHLFTVHTADAMSNLIISNICNSEMLLRCFRHALIQLRLARLRLPGFWTAGCKHILNLFERLVAGLRVREVKLNGCEEAHRTEDNEHAPFDVDEAGRNV